MVTHQPQPATGESACLPAPRWFSTGAACTQLTNLEQVTNPPEEGQFFFTSTLHAGTLAEKLMQSRV